MMAKPLKITIIDRAAERSASVPEPTPERYARAGGDIRKGADGVRRVEEDPLDRLYTRKCLDRADDHRNHVLYLAGKRYYEHWYSSGLAGPGSVDLLQCGGGSDHVMPPSAMPRSESAAHHRGQFRQAHSELGMYFTRVVDPIILECRDPASVGSLVSGQADLNRGRVVAIDRLSEALARLAKMWGMSS